MNYDERIEQVNIVIQSFTGAMKINAICPAPIDDSDWKNSEARVAAEELLNSLDTILSVYSQHYTEWLEALEARKSQIQTQKMTEFHYHQSMLIGLTGEDRENYLENVTMDSSVRAMF